MIGFMPGVQGIPQLFRIVLVTLTQLSQPSIQSPEAALCRLSFGRGVWPLSFNSLKFIGHRIDAVLGE